jgi:hypothetical protein
VECFFIIGPLNLNKMYDKEQKLSQIYLSPCRYPKIGIFLIFIFSGEKMDNRDIYIVVRSVSGHASGIDLLGWFKTDKEAFEAIEAEPARMKQGASFTVWCAPPACLKESTLRTTVSLDG